MSRKHRLVGGLARLTDLLREAGHGEELRPFQELKEKLLQEQFQVVVMGEFKRGKSSLINALLGQSVLPVAAVPLTSVVTVVKAGPQLEVSVEMLDGRRQEIAPSAIEDFVSEERNPKNQKGVDRVVVQAPAPFLQGGTLLVDTPGAGSVYRHNTEVAQKYLPQSDAVILVLSADPPISQSEVEFLNSIRRWTRKLFVVLNKIDYLSPADLEKSTAFTLKVLREALDDPQAVLYPISAKLALEAKHSENEALLEESRFRSLSGVLENFLRKEKGDLLVDAVRVRAANILERRLLEIDLRISAIKDGPEQWAAKIKELGRRLDAAKRKQYESSRLFHTELKDHIKAMEESLYSRTVLESRKIARELDEQYQSIRSKTAPEVREELNKTFIIRIDDFFSRFLAEEEPKWTMQFSAMTDRALENTLAVVNEVLRESAPAFGAEHRPLGKPVVAVAPPTVWFVLEEVSIWSGGLGSVPTLRIFKPFFWRALRKKIGEAMDVNAGRLRYDYSNRLEKAGQEALEFIEKFFESSIGTLEKALPSAKERREEALRGAEDVRSALEQRKRSLLKALAQIAD